MRISSRAVAFAAVLMLLLALGVGPAAAVPVPLASADLNTVGGKVVASTVHGTCTSFNPEISGVWGGEFGGGAVTSFPGDSDEAGYCSFEWESGKAKHIELRVLDGLGDDSFDVFVKNLGGNWAWVYGYMDAAPTWDDPEMWAVHHIWDFPAGKGQGPKVELMIVPTGPHWQYWSTYGQLGIDYVKIWHE